MAPKNSSIIDWLLSLANDSSSSEFVSFFLCLYTSVSVDLLISISITMNDQRFKYYTGYEVDNEPSDDDDDEVDIPSSTAIAQDHRSSER